MGIDECRVIPICSASCFCFWFIFACAAIPMSIKSVEQGQFALKLNWVTQQIDDAVVTDPGMYTVGLGNMLIEFPSTFQNMYFVSNTKGIAGGGQDVIRGPVRARSADGLEMFISVSFQWKLEPQALRPLYLILGEDLYRDEFVRFARASFVESCSRYNANSFFTNRTEITVRMHEALAVTFNHPTKGLQVSIQGLQLREVDLPDAFDVEIANTQEMLQDVDTANAEREQAIVVVSRDLLLAQNAVSQSIQEAMGQAANTRLSNEATVQQLLVFQEKQALANAAILEVFANDTSPFTRLFEVMEVRALSDHDNAKLLVNI